MDELDQEYRIMAAESVPGPHGERVVVTGIRKIEFDRLTTYEFCFDFLGDDFPPLSEEIMADFQKVGLKHKIRLSSGSITDHSVNATYILPQQGRVNAIS